MDYWQLFWETGAPEWYVMNKTVGVDAHIDPQNSPLKEVATSCKMKSE